MDNRAVDTSTIVAVTKTEAAISAVPSLGWTRSVKNFTRGLKLIPSQLSLVDFSYTLFLFTKSDIKTALLPIVSYVFINLLT